MRTASSCPWQHQATQHLFACPVLQRLFLFLCWRYLAVTSTPSLTATGTHSAINHTFHTGRALNASSTQFQNTDEHGQVQYSRVHINAYNLTNK